MIKRVAIVITAVLVASAAAQEEPAPDLAKLVERGAESERRLAAGAASWTMSLDLSNGNARFVVRVLKSKERRRILVAVNSGGKEQELARIVEKEGLWYYAEQGLRTKCRPYEAPSAVSVIYLPISRSTPRFLDSKDVREAREDERE